MKLLIQTLGNFDIVHNGESILQESARSYKLYRLFQYFITYRDRRLLPETIIDNLYQDNESDDPKNVLRTQIYRLRQTFKKLIGKDRDVADYFNINISNGYYFFELGKSAMLDIDEFEKYIAQGETEITKDIDKALKNYQKALELYRGPYLSANAYETWLVPIRNRFNMLYMKTFYKIIGILEAKDDYYGICNLCEEALTMEPYEESIHITLIDGMLRLGQVKNAMSHYIYITSLLKKEMDINPSPAFKSIYKKIQSHYDEKKETDIDVIKTRLEDKELDGALQCELDYFKVLYNMEKRKASRDGNSGFISLISINSMRSDTEEGRNKIIKIMVELLGNSLRKGDVYSFWNDNQILLLLHGAKENDLWKIEDRIKKGFIKNIKSDNYKIDINFKPLSVDLSQSITKPSPSYIL